MKKVIALLALIILLVVPIIPTTYEVVSVVTKHEEFTTIEPYTVTETVRVPYTTTAQEAIWHDGGYREWKNQIYFSWRESVQAFGRVQPGYYTMRSYPITKYRTVEQEVTKYREVTDARAVMVPVITVKSKRVSILQLVVN